MRSVCQLMSNLGKTIILSATLKIMTNYDDELTELNYVTCIL